MFNIIYSLDYDYDYDNLFEFNSPTSSYDPNFKNEKLTTNTIDDLGKEEKFFYLLYHLQLQH